MKPKHFKNQAGFAIGTILLIVALIAVISGAIALASRSTNTSTAEQSAKVLASTVVQQGTTMRGGFEKMMVSGLSIATVTFDTTAATGLFNPTDGGAVQQFPPAESLLTTTNQWVYKVDGSSNAVVKLKGIGVTATEDYMIALADLKQAVCEQINKLLYGSTTVPTLSVGAAADWNTAVTTLDLSADNAVDKKPEQCVKTTDSKYVFYKTVVEK